MVFESEPRALSAPKGAFCVEVPVLSLAFLALTFLAGRLYVPAFLSAVVAIPHVGRGRAFPRAGDRPRRCGAAQEMARWQEQHAGRCPGCIQTRLLPLLAVSAHLLRCSRRSLAPCSDSLE